MTAAARAGSWVRRWLGPPPRPRHPLFRDAPLLVAHRGASGLAPENTLVAFREAVERWDAPMLELDVHSSADGACVVIHDPTVDRTTGGTGSVASMTMTEIRRLDAGFHFTPDGGRSYPFRGRGLFVPTLEEVLDAVPVPIVAEIKSGSAQEPLLRAVGSRDAYGRVVIAGSEARDRSLLVDYPGATSATARDLKRFWILHRLGLSGLWTPDADVANLPEYHRGRRVLTPRLVRALHDRGLAVQVWTVNDPADMNRLLDWGVDGIITDRPDVFRQVLAAREKKA